MSLLRYMSEEEKEDILTYKGVYPYAQYSTYYGAKGALDSGKMTPDEKEGYIKIHDILKKVIDDFVSFSGFINEDTLRIQYRWSPLFTGMGLVTLDELVYGFKVEGE